MVTQTLTLPTRSLVTSTPKACLLKLNDDMKFWWPRSLLRHDKHGYHLTLLPSMVVEIQHRKARESCLASELHSLCRFQEPVTQSVDRLESLSSQHLASIARE